jgi:hypothetical protein
MENAAASAVNKPASPKVAGTAARRRGVRWASLVALLLVVLAFVQIAVRGMEDWSWVPDIFSSAALFLFGAALMWAAPEDRPLVRYGALVIAGAGLLAFLPGFMTANLVSDPMLMGTAYWLGISSAFLLTTGLVLVSIAYGVIHSRPGWTIFWIGALVGIGGLILVTTHMSGEVGPLDVLVLSAIQIVPLAWGYMSATFLGVSRWISRGAALMLVYMALSQAVIWLGYDAGDNSANARFLIGLVHAIAWAALIGGSFALRPSDARTHAQESHSPGR